MVPIMSSSKKKSRQSRQKPQAAPAGQKAVVTPLPPETPSETPVMASVAEPQQEAQAGPAEKLFSWKPSLPTLLLLGILVVGLAFRMLPALFAIKDGHVLFAEFDPYYHMRRIAFAVHNFPFTNVFDPYVNYPVGYYVGWPPLLDVTAAALSLIVGLGHPDQFTVELVSATLPVVFGLLAIVAAYLFVRDTFNEKAALLAAFVMAIIPASIFRATFGFTDHHVLEVLLSLTLYVLFMRAVTRAKARKLTLRNLSSNKEPLVYAALAGIAIAAMVFTWDGAPILIGAVLLYALLQYSVDAGRKESSEYLSIVGALASAVALLLVAPAALTSYHGLRLEVSAIYLSLFHAIFMAGLLGFFLFIEGLRRAVASAKAPWFALPAGIVVAAGAGLLVTKFALPQVFTNLEGGIAFLTGASQYGPGISEVSPLLVFDGQFSIIIIVLYFSTAMVLGIVGAIWFLYSFLKTKPGNQEIFFLVWALVIIAIGLLQSRFVYQLGACTAVFAGYAMYKILAVAGLDRLLEHRAAGAAKGKNQPFRMPPLLLPAAIVLLLVLVPTAQASYDRYTLPEPYTQDWNEAALWLKNHSPPTAGVYSQNMSVVPEYGVMTWWDYGNFVLYRAERPAVANNFQTGIEDSAQFFVAQNETAADRLMDLHNARYVMLDKRSTSNTINGFAGGGRFEAILSVTGDDMYSYFMLYRMPQPYSNVVSPEGNEKYYNAMFSRMYYGWGCGGMSPIGGSQNGLEHYSLLYTTNGFDPVQVYEYVKGATLTGTARPGAKVEIRLDVTNGNVTKTYDSATLADATGAYRFTVPYSTGSAGNVRTGPDYTITSGAGTVKVQVPEDAVTSGKTIAVGGI